MGRTGCEQAVQASDAPPLELHRLRRSTGEWRAGPVVTEFETLYEQLTRETFKMKLAQVADGIDRFVYDDALALFLCEPQALYAVNRHVAFAPYRTTFELAGCRVADDH